MQFERPLLRLPARFGISAGERNGSRAKTSSLRSLTAFLFSTLAFLGSSERALGQTLTWKGYEWFPTYASPPIRVNDDDNLIVITADTEFGLIGGASRQVSSAVQTATASWAEATFFDTLSEPGPQIFLIAFQPSGSGYASLGAIGNRANYSAHWRTDASTPADAIYGTNIDLSPRSYGVHTARIGRRADGRLEFWLDGTLVLTSMTNAFPRPFDFVSLIGSNANATGQVATFIDYAEGTGPAGSSPPTVTTFTDRTLWQGAVQGLTTINFENVAPAGGLVSFDNPAGLSISGANFAGVTTVAGPSGPARWYLKVVDAAHSPPSSDWGSGALLQGPPIPVGPEGEGGRDSHIRIRLPPDVRSVGVDLMSVLQYASSFKIVVATNRGSVAFTANSAAYPGRSFFGFTSDSPVLSVDYYALNGFPLLDNVAFGATTLEPPCTISLSPTTQSFGPQGGVGSFTVLTSRPCTWSAVASESWVRILPGSGCTPVGDVVICPLGPRKVNFTVGPNASGLRNASISVSDKTFSVAQLGVPSLCSLSIGPVRSTVDAAGGNLRVTVTALPPQAPCAWTAVSNAGWLTVTSGASGTRSGAVVLHADANTGGPRTGTAMIAGQTFSVSQGAGACGAVDVTSRVRVDRGGLTYVPFTSYLYSGNITVGNTGSPASAIPGPLFLVLEGLPTAFGYPNDSGLNGPQTKTTCFSPEGDYLIPFSGGSLPYGRFVTLPLMFFTQRVSGTINYKPRVLSGQPSR
jgi:all-beta uncharacterized protein